MRNKLHWLLFGCKHVSLVFIIRLSFEICGIFSSKESNQQNDGRINQSKPKTSFQTCSKWHLGSLYVKVIILNDFEIKKYN
jgi:hypothetical protein